MKVAYVLYPDFTALDLVGPYGAGLSAVAGLLEGNAMLSLTERVDGRQLAETLQLVIEYDPQLPLNSGSPTKADASTLRLALRVLPGDRPVRMATRMNSQAVAANSAGSARAVPTMREQAATGRVGPRMT
jgi:hypothetical protein